MFSWSSPVVRQLLTVGCFSRTWIPFDQNNPRGLFALFMCFVDTCHVCDIVLHFSCSLIFAYNSELSENLVQTKTGIIAPRDWQESLFRCFIQLTNPLNQIVRLKNICENKLSCGEYHSFEWKIGKRCRHFISVWCENTQKVGRAYGNIFKSRVKLFISLSFVYSLKSIFHCGFASRTVRPYGRMKILIKKKLQYFFPVPISTWLFL